MRWRVILPAGALVLGALAATALAKLDESPRITAEPNRNVVIPERSALVSPRLGMFTRAPEGPPSECEPGERKACFGPGKGPGLPRSDGSIDYPPTMMACQKSTSGAWHWNRNACDTPLVVAFDGEDPAFTRPAGSFTIGAAPRTEWISARTAWLALDADGSGCVEDQRELFGPPLGGENGFDSLARLDEDHDGVVDAHDPAFARLILWFDRDQDRRCTPGEVKRPAELGIVSFDLAYERLTPARPGSFSGEQAPIRLSPAAPHRRARLVDVYLMPLP